MLDFPASGQALWAIYDSTGIRPEYLLPTLWAESGFRPDIQNAAGAPYYGLNQVSASYLQNMGVTSSDYLTWAASRQLSTVVQPYMAGIASRYGTPHSGIRVEQGNFYPASLATAIALSSIIVSSPSAAYSGNAGLDYNKTGTITVQDLGTFLQKGIASSKGAVQAAINSTYALRPGETPQDPIYGTDFSASPFVGLVSAAAKPLLIAGSLLVLASLVSEAIRPGSSPLSPKGRRALGIPT